MSISYRDISSRLRILPKLKGNAYLVGGIITEGMTNRDIDVVFDNMLDLPILKKTLGKYASKAHFLFQKGKPPATFFLCLRGGEPTKSPDTFKGKGKIPVNEYAGSSK
jgi:hypothetical protein